MHLWCSEENPRELNSVCVHVYVCVYVCLCVSVYACLCVCAVCVHVPLCTCDIQRIIYGSWIQFFPLILSVPEWNLSCQTWWQAPLPAEPSCLSSDLFLKRDLLLKKEAKGHPSLLLPSGLLLGYVSFLGVPCWNNASSRKNQTGQLLYLGFSKLSLGRCSVLHLIRGRSQFHSLMLQCFPSVSLSVRHPRTSWISYSTSPSGLHACMYMYILAD